MSGITSSVGLFSGINTGQIIEQLLSIESRPKQQAQARILKLQLQQGAFLDLNTRLSSLRSAAKVFREAKTFQTKNAASSDEDVLTATAGTGASPGSYQFIVDRLVTTQQALSRGFANKDSAAIGATSFSFESVKARLDRDVALADLNGGQGVARGKIVISDRGTGTATIDLSRTTSVQEVLDAINSNGTAQVTASVEGGKFVIRDTSGSTARALTVANAAGYTTADSLGIAGTGAGSTLTGSTLYALNGNTTLASLNDGNGVSIRNVIGLEAHSFRINLTDIGNVVTTVNVNLGDVYQEQVVDGVTKLVKTQGAVTTVQGAIDRINQSLTAEGVTTATAAIDAANGRLVINETSGAQTLTVVENGDSTAADLGIFVAPTSTSILGKRVFAGINSSLARGLNGGRGIAGDGVLNFTLRDGSTFSTTIDTTGTLTDIFAQVQAASTSRVRVGLDANGTGLVVTDLTAGSGSLTIAGTVGSDSAASLGIAQTSAAGTISSGNLQRQYLSRATLLSSLNNGRGIGTGKFRITDGDGLTEVVNISDNVKSVGELLTAIEAGSLRINARINANGDGIEIVEDTTTLPAGTVRLKIEDESGSVAKSLNLAGTAAAVGVTNTLNGSFERTVTFSAADTLQQVTDKINAAGVGVSAAIVRDGGGATPFRLSLASSASGAGGRFLLNTGGLDLALQTLEAGQDARAFYGSADPARAIAVGGSSNSLDEILPGVKIDLRRVSQDPVTITVTTDTDGILESVNAFVSAFNNVIDRIDLQTKYDVEAKKGGPLLGEGTAIELRSVLFSMIQSPGRNTTGRFSRLTDLGFSIDSGGNIALDEDRFRQAYAEDPASVESLFTTRVQADDQFIDVPDVDGVRVRNPNAGTTFTSLGVMGQIEELATRYVDSTAGLLTGRSKSLAEQIVLQQDRITAFDARLERRRAALQRQFSTMESTIGRLQGQQGALASLSSISR